MVVIFDLNNTIIYKEATNSKCDVPRYKIHIRPYLIDLLEYLNKHNIRFGVWSFSRQDNFDNIMNFLESKNITFHYKICTHPPLPKKDLNTISHIVKAPESEIILIEDNERKCIAGQNYAIVNRFDGKNISCDEELKNLEPTIKSFFKL